jgi:hypothetical protein
LLSNVPTAWVAGVPSACRYGKEPEAQLNPKRKIFEKIASELRVDASTLAHAYWSLSAGRWGLGLGVERWGLSAGGWGLRAALY